MPDIPNGYYRISIKALIVNEEKKFLLFQEENGTWELPGGGLDFGETPQECLVRELKEEAGMHVTWVSKNPAYFVTGVLQEETWKAAVLYETKVESLNFTPSDECVTFRFFSREEALREKIYTTVESFAKEFNPENH